MIKYINSTPFIALILLSLISCEKKNIEVEISNETGKELGIRTIELSAPDILNRLNSKSFYITDAKGKEIPSQLTHDSLIIFNCEVAADSSETFIIHKADTTHTYPATVWGQTYPNRRDDLSYENELVGFRIYGPATQKAGERAYGYDLFFKYPTEELVLPELYHQQTSSENWAKVDSLRKIDPSVAKEFENSFTYHLDHGKGMDCYAVGPTLGAGVAAILENDSIIYPWCYQSVEILDNGPIRFTAQLKFPVSSFNGKEIIENRILSLDSYTFLNNCKIWFERLSDDIDLVTGFPLRDDSKPVVNSNDGLLAYADPTQGENNGKALLGIKTEFKAENSIEKDNHILLVYHLGPNDKFHYKWGFSWNKTEISTMEEWVNYLEKADLKYKIEIK